MKIEDIEITKSRSGEVIHKEFLQSALNNQSLTNKISIQRASAEAGIFLKVIEEIYSVDSEAFNLASACGVFSRETGFFCRQRSCPVCAQHRNIGYKKRIFKKVKNADYGYFLETDYNINIYKPSDTFQPLPFQFRQITIFFDKDDLEAANTFISKFKDLKVFRQHVTGGYYAVYGYEKINIFYQGFFWDKEDIAKLLNKKVWVRLIDISDEVFILQNEIYEKRAEFQKAYKEDRWDAYDLKKKYENFKDESAPKIRDYVLEYLNNVAKVIGNTMSNDMEWKTEKELRYLIATRTGKRLFISGGKFYNQKRKVNK
jgi:hypothetical protein